jgi:hypothetical protein
VEPAALAKGGGEGDDGAGRDGEHGADGVVELVGDAGGFVDDQETDAGVAADGVFQAGEADHAAAVDQLQAEGAASIAGRVSAESVVEAEELTIDLLGLAQSRGEHEDEGTGLVEGLVEGESGGDGALAGLAAAEEEGVLSFAEEEFGLPGVRG